MSQLKSDEVFIDEIKKNYFQGHIAKEGAVKGYSPSPCQSVFPNLKNVKNEYKQISRVFCSSLLKKNGKNPLVKQTEEKIQDMALTMHLMKKLNLIETKYSTDGT